MDSLQLALLCRDLADNKKAENILVLDVRKLSSITDYFVLASGSTEPHLRAIVSEITDRLRKEHEVRARAVEGCSSTTDIPPNTFFAAAVSGTGCNVCALPTGTLTGATCGPTTCLEGCLANGTLNNDFFGCGTLGTPLTTDCDGLDRASGNNCTALTTTWQCNGETMESRTVTKSGAANGGVLCCRE